MLGSKSRDALGVFFVQGGIRLPNDFCSLLAPVDEAVQDGSDALFAGALLRSFGRRVGEMLGGKQGSSDDVFLNCLMMWLITVIVWELTVRFYLDWRRLW